MKANKRLDSPLRILSWRRIIKWMFRTLWVVGISVLYYLLLSLFLDTPLESEIKKSNRKLEEQYSILQERYDTIHSVMNNVIQRDREIHKILFESQPYTSWQDSTKTSENIATDFKSKNNMELGDQLIQGTSMLYQRIHGANASMNSMQSYVVEHRNEINKIPAIQPVDNPDFTLLTASFGQRIQPFYKTMKQHNGVDFSVPAGTAVFATADGIVVEIQMRGQSSGISIKVRHSDTYETFYANLGRVMTQVGQQINRGDIIAFSGNSGMSFAPHLHYEVRYKGKAVDPLNYFFLEVDIHNFERLKRIAATGMQSFD